MDLPKVIFAEASPELMEPDNLKRVMAMGLVLYKVRENGCQIIVSHSPNGGDGHVYIYRKGKKHVLCHIAWTQQLGPIPDDNRVYQTCGSRLCINPDHLTLKTPAEIQGAGKKDRLPENVEVISEPLTPRDEDLIRRLWNFGASKRSILLSFGISRYVFDRLRRESLGLVEP